MGSGAKALLACGALAALAPLLSVAATAAPHAEAPLDPSLDRDPPVILPLPADPTRVSEPLVLRAKVVDASGVAEVHLLVQGELERAFRPFPMRREQGDVFAAKLPPGPWRGRAVRFMVEATDELGNGPRRSGDPSAPYLATLLPDEDEKTGGWKPPSALLAALAVIVVGLPIGALCLVKGRERRTVRRLREQAFWLAHLAPLLALDASDRSRAISALCGRDLDHPQRGSFRPARTEVQHWLERCRGLDIGRFREQCRRRLGSDRVALPAAAGKDPRAVQIADDLFWLRLLTPLLDLPPEELQVELRVILSRKHNYPSRGQATFTRPEVIARLRWAQAVDPAELLARYREIHSAVRVSEGRPAPSPSATEIPS